MTDVQRRILALAFGAIAWAARAHAANELCGQTITQNPTFTVDQSCTATGLTVGADGITIDLGLRETGAPSFLVNRELVEYTARRADPGHE